MQAKFEVIELEIPQLESLLEKIRSGAGAQLAVSLGRRDGPLEQIRRSHETFDPLRDEDAATRQVASLHRIPAPGPGPAAEAGRGSQP